MALGASAAPVYVIYPQSKNKSVKKLELIFCLSLLFTSVTRSGSSVLICYCSDSSSFFVVYAFTNSINGSGGINLCFRVFRTLCVPDAYARAETFSNRLAIELLFLL